MGEDEEGESFIVVIVVGRVCEDDLSEPLRESFGGLDGGLVLRGCDQAAVILSSFDDGVDEWSAAVVYGFEVGNEWVDGVSDAGVRGENGVDATSSLIQAFILSSRTCLVP